jgi:hypothetical protein
MDMDIDLDIENTKAELTISAKLSTPAARKDFFERLSDLFETQPTSEVKLKLEFFGAEDLRMAKNAIAKKLYHRAPGIEVKFNTKIEDTVLREKKQPEATPIERALDEDLFNTDDEDFELEEEYS